MENENAFTKGERLQIGDVEQALRLILRGLKIDAGSVDRLVDEFVEKYPGEKITFDSDYLNPEQTRQLKQLMQSFK